MNAEDGMMVENSHFHENWNVKLSLRFRVSANQQNLISSDQKKKKKKKSIILSSSSGKSSTRPLNTIDYIVGIYLLFFFIFNFFHH